MYNIGHLATYKYKGPANTKYEYKFKYRIKYIVDPTKWETQNEERTLA